MEKQKITVYGTPTCSKCKAFKRTLDSKKYEYEYIDNINTLMEISSNTNIVTAPIVKIGSNYMNYDDAEKLISTWSN